jgi:hypothetical protein
VNVIPLPCPICERPAKRAGENVICPACCLTWTNETAPADGADMRLGDLALRRFLVEGYRANLYRAETDALAGEVPAAMRQLGKALDYFLLIEATVT